MATVDIYTDGACSGNPGPGGIGVVLIHKGTKKEISKGYDNTTNNRMEMQAVITALSALKKRCTVNLYTDSRYVVDSINKGWVYNWQKNKWKKSNKEPALNVDLWEEILTLLPQHDITFIWVKGHANNVYNERCDQLAREAVPSAESTN